MIRVCFVCETRMKFIKSKKDKFPYGIGKLRTRWTWWKCPIHGQWVIDMLENKIYRDIRFVVEDDVEENEGMKINLNSRMEE